MNIILVLSAILLQVPLALYKDTVRRFQQMELYNLNKAHYYTLMNGFFTDITWQVNLFLLFGYILSFIPLVKGFNIHWGLCLIIHLILVFIITPIIVFIFHPYRKILSRYSVNIIGIASLILGTILFIMEIKK